jgi:hypothetical protein
MDPDQAEYSLADSLHPAGRGESQIPLYYIMLLAEQLPQFTGHIMLMISA